MESDDVYYEISDDEIEFNNEIKDNLSIKINLFNFDQLNESYTYLEYYFKFSVFKQYYELHNKRCELDISESLIFKCMFKFDNYVHNNKNNK